MATPNGGIDMHAMVDNLKKEKQQHEEGIAGLTLNQLREKVISNATSFAYYSICITY